MECEYHGWISFIIFLSGIKGKKMTPHGNLKCPKEVFWSATWALNTLENPKELFTTKNKLAIWVQRRRDIIPGYSISPINIHFQVSCSNEEGKLRWAEEISMPIPTKCKKFSWQKVHPNFQGEICFQCTPSFPQPKVYLAVFTCEFWPSQYP